MYLCPRIGHSASSRERTNSLTGYANAQHKGRHTMGDKSPKSAQKQNSQKQAKLDQAKQVKQQAIFAKQSANKKK